MRLETERGKQVRLGSLLGKGGQGMVYKLANNNIEAVKIYHTPTKKLEDKIRFLTVFPEDKRPSSFFAAWPVELIYATTGQWWWKKREFVGYTMPFVQDAYPIFYFYTPSMRKKHQWNFSWHDMHSLALHLAMAFEQFHELDLVIGDVNCNNILVNKYLMPTLIDIDSIQLFNWYTPDVGFEEYTPPELAGQSLKNMIRTKYHDLFGLGHLVFQLLMNGCSPFAGVPSDDLDWEYVDAKCKELGIFPFYPNPYVAPPLGMPTVNVFHPEVAKGFLACFIKGRRNPEVRPDARTWQEKLKTAIQNLITCSQDSSHIYSSHLSYCPWCK